VQSSYVTPLKNDEGLKGVLTACYSECHYVYAVFVKLPDPSYVKVFVVNIPDGIDPLRTMLVKIPRV
jgi:hypothetical protein